MRNALTQARARELRHRMTDAEQLLWRHLRRENIGGHRFRRQVPLGRFIADFVCIERRLIIELDGGHHSEQHTRDASREAHLRSRGFRVLRFWNNEVLQQTDAVLEVILTALKESSS